MRRYPKYYYISKTLLELQKFPKKLLCFKRSKWVSIKKRNLLSRIPFLIDILVVKRSFHSWERVNTFTKRKFILQRFLSSLNEGSKISVRNRNRYHSSHLLIRKLVILRSLIKKEFKLDFLLSNLNYCNGIYESKQKVSSGEVLVNGISVCSNYIVKKGDIITYHKSDFQLSDVIEKYKQDHRIFPFIEVDNYLGAVVVIKDYDSLSHDDFKLLLSKCIDITQLIE